MAATQARYETQTNLRIGTPDPGQTEARYASSVRKLLRQAGETYSLLSTTEAPEHLVRAAWQAFESVRVLAELSQTSNTQHCTRQAA